MKREIRILDSIEQEVVNDIRVAYLKFLGEKLEEDFSAAKSAAKKNKSGGPRDEWGRLK